MNTMKIAVQALLSTLLVSSMAQAQENELGWTMDSAVKQLDRQGSDMSTVLAEVEIAYTGSDENLGAVKSGRTVSYYNEGLARVDEYSLSKHKGRLEPFMPLGFSTTGRDLKKDYLVTFVGEDNIGGRRILGLELTPTSDSWRAMVSKIQIWFDQASWLPARQIISHTSGTGTLTITYSGTARNLNLNSDLFRANWPRGTQEVRK